MNAIKRKLVGHAVNNVTISQTREPQQQAARTQDWQANSSECNTAVEAFGPARRVNEANYLGFNLPGFRHSPR